MAKVVKIRTARLTENNPTLGVQATRPDRAPIEKDEYEQTPFWFLWATLALHSKIRHPRLWASKGGLGVAQSRTGRRGGLRISGNADGAALSGAGMHPLRSRRWSGIIDASLKPGYEATDVPTRA